MAGHIMSTADDVTRDGGSAGTARGKRRAMSPGIFAVVVSLVACLHLAFWALRNPHAAAPSVEGRLPSVSYNRFAEPSPDGLNVPEARIRADLTAIAKYAKAVRTYASTQGLERVPGIAAELGLNVTLGVWIDKDNARNEREIASALDLARRYPNVTRLVVGNETVYRKELTVAELIKIVRRVKQQSPIPVASAENWQTFAEHPEFGDAVDQIFAHIIPYWEGFPRETAVRESLAIYDKLRAAYPNKKIVIGEFGWPSAGHNFESAVPSPIAQAVILRDFVARADARDIDYNIVEAIDQKEKLFEGNVGPYWGILDTSLRPKFPWTGPIVDHNYWKTALLAVLAGFLLSITILALPGATVVQATLLAVADHLIGHWCASVLVYWQTHYLLHGEAITFAIALPLLGLLAPIVRSRVNELAAVAFGRGPARLLKLSPPMTRTHSPKVSIHIPAYREAPDMLLQTIDSVARLDYPNFECVVVINNTPDPAFWQPIEARCRELGPRFKFLRVEDLQGFKAAALRLAMAKAAADAEIIGVIDADYVVDPRWLSDLVPSFADPEVGLIQAPQDHRDGDRSLIHAAMNAEYAGFFDIGMVERNEFNAIIVHGTMCLIRRAAMEAAGGWSSDTICEDSDLGLSILEHGWQVHYTNRRYGHGLLPDTFEAYKKQRYRWAYGGFQILKKHWRQLLPRARRLTPEQKREFALGWLNWLGAETLGVAVAILNLAWVPVVAFLGIAIPDKILTLPILAAFVVTFAHFVALYRLRVPITVKQMVGAVLAAMSVQLTVARAVGSGVWTESVPFTRTAKGGATRKGPDFPAFWEGFLAALLLIGAAVVVHSNDKQIREINVVALVL